MIFRIFKNLGGVNILGFDFYSEKMKKLFPDFLHKKIEITIDPHQKYDILLLLSFPIPMTERRCLHGTYNFILYLCYSRDNLPLSLQVARQRS